MVLGTAPDFKDFHVHLPTFLWQMQCFAERIIRKRLSDSFIHNSAIVRLNVNSSCVSHHGQRLCKLSCCSSVCYCSEFPQQLILKLTSDLQDWIALWTLESNNVILV